MVSKSGVRANNKKVLLREICRLITALETNHGRQFERFYSHVDHKTKRSELVRVFDKLHKIALNIEKGELKHGIRN